MFKFNTVLPWLILALVLTVYGLFLARPINLVTADLGRHIKNGELVSSGQTNVLKTNFYSYTYSDFPVTNHHWVSGIVFYIVWKLSGFVGLHLFFITLSLAAFLVFFLLARQRAGAGLAALLSIFIIPLLLERDEIRPEVFSYLFAGIFFWLMLKYRSGLVRPRTLFIILPVLEIFWVNLHIYFFLGPAIVGIFALETLISKKWTVFKNLGGLFLVVLLATLINPFGLEGTLAPLSIFKNFGYRLAENQPVWFIEKIIPNPNYLIFKIMFAVLMLSFVLKFAKNRRLINFSDLILALVFSAMGWLAIRNFALFGFFALPIAAGNLASTFNLKPKTVNWLNRTVLTTLTLIVLITVSGELNALYPHASEIKLGLENGNEASLQFFKANNLTGPIFNNYDIGGYLIYGLPQEEKVYPEQSRRVFVDNRPEAYPAEFFEKTYVPMQEDEIVWREKLKEYDFKTIIFSHLDYTPWGQNFLANRLADPEWKTVFKDSRVIILVKN